MVGEIVHVVSKTGHFASVRQEVAILRSVAVVSALAGQRFSLACNVECELIDVVIGISHGGRGNRSNEQAQGHDCFGE